MCSVSTAARNRWNLHGQHERRRLGVDRHVPQHRAEHDLQIGQHGTSRRPAGGCAPARLDSDRRSCAVCQRLRREHDHRHREREEQRAVQPCSMASVRSSNSTRMPPSTPWKITSASAAKPKPSHPAALVASATARPASRSSACPPPTPSSRWPCSTNKSHGPASHVCHG